MKDIYEREIDYVRVSVTDRCNLRCVYCMPEKGIAQVPHASILSYDEIVKICESFAELGIRKIKVTGGEPLVRKNLSGLVRDIKNISGIEKVTLTTNGVLLGEQLDALAAAGLDGVNISLDTLNPETYSSITRGGQIQRVLDSIDKVLEYPHMSLKINCVPMGADGQDLTGLSSLAKDRPIHVRFIEMMPIGLGKNFAGQTEDEIKTLLEDAYGPMTAYNESLGSGPSHYYSIDGFKGKIGFISAISHKFCHKCNRVRLSAEGYLKTCLQYEIGKDLKPYLNDETEKSVLTGVIKKAIFHKPHEHAFNDEYVLDCAERAPMNSIGG